MSLIRVRYIDKEMDIDWAKEFVVKDQNEAVKVFQDNVKNIRADMGMFATKEELDQDQLYFAIWERKNFKNHRVIIRAI